MLKAAFSPESWPLIFNFLTFLLHFMLDPGQNPDQDQEPEPERIAVPVLLRQKVAVPAVPQHYFSSYNYVYTYSNRFVANCCKERVFFAATKNVYILLLTIFFNEPFIIKLCTTNFIYT